MIKWTTILPVTALLLAGCAQHRSESDSTWMGGTSTTSSQETGTSSSASASSQSSSTTSTLSQEDQQFLKEAVQGGMAEVQMGRLASQKGQSEAVKQLGQKLVQDHTKANQELKQLASKKGVTLTSEPGTEHKGALDHLRSLQGQEFDKAFTQHAVQDHQKDIQKFEKASQSQDPEIKAFAAKTLPVLKQHLQMAKSADTQGAGSSSTSDSGTTSGNQSEKSPSQTPEKQQ